MSNAINHSIQRAVSELQGIATSAARRRTREQLLALSDRRLDDLGFDRRALERGIDGFPWQIAANDPGETRHAA